MDDGKSNMFWQLGSSVQVEQFWLLLQIAMP